VISEDLTSLLKLGQYDFAIYALAQRRDLEIAPFHHRLIDQLEAVERGEQLRTMVLMPPRHGKSLLCTELFPAWYLGRHPDRLIISASYGGSRRADYRSGSTSAFAR
jgi:hypothetical protein